MNPYGNIFGLNVFFDETSDAKYISIEQIEKILRGVEFQDTVLPESIAKKILDEPTAGHYAICGYCFVRTYNQANHEIGSLRLVTQISEEHAPALLVSVIDLKRDDGSGEFRITSASPDKGECLYWQMQLEEGKNVFTTLDNWISLVETKITERNVEDSLKAVL